MLKRLNIYFFACILTIFVFSNCQKTKKYPPEPYIEFISFEFIDTVIFDNRGLYGTLRFYFIDGDGDIGFHQPVDTIEKENKTVFIDKYVMQNNKYVLQELNIPMNYRVPYFSTSGNNLTLEGEIIVKDINIIPTHNNTSVFEDTIMYKFYIKDRAGNKSNVDSTGALILKDFLKE